MTLLRDDRAATRCLRCSKPFRFLPTRDGAVPPFCPACLEAPFAPHPNWRMPHYGAPVRPLADVQRTADRASDLRRELRDNGVRSPALLGRSA